MMSAKAASESPIRKGTAIGRALTVFRRKLFTWFLVTVFVGMMLVHSVVAETFTVPSISMEPTFHPGDRILVNKLADSPQRGDVVVFAGSGSLDQHDAPEGLRGVLGQFGGLLGFRFNETDYLKRVIALGGDRLSVGQDGLLRINGQVTAEPYLKPGMKASEDPFSVTVPAGTVFVMGDNRNHSNDSRQHLGEPGGGFVPVDKIVGQVSWRYWRG